MAAQLKGVQDAQRELDAVAKEEAHLWDQENETDNVFDMEGDIFVCNYLISLRIFTLCMLACMFATWYFQLPYTYVLFLCVLLVVVATNRPHHVEIRAKTKYLHDEMDERPSSDKGRTVVLGKVYELHYYWVLVFESPMGPTRMSNYGIQIVSMVLMSVDPQFMAFIRQHQLYPSSISPLSHAVAKDCVSTSCIQELLGRKTTFSRDPQYTTLAQRLDMISTNRDLYMTRGISVGNCTIKYLRLVHSSTTVQPFQHLLTVVPSNMDTAFTITGYAPSTHLSKIVSKLSSTLRNIPSLILDVLKWLALVASVLVVIAFSVLILQMLSPSLQDARSDLLFGARQLVQKWIGQSDEGLEGSPNYFCDNSPPEGTFDPSTMHPPSPSGSPPPTTPVPESTNSMPRNSTWDMTITKFAIALTTMVLTTCVKSAAMMIAWAIPIVMAYLQSDGSQKRKETTTQLSLAVTVLITFPPLILGMFYVVYLMVAM
jgi:hypothetical protein